MAIRYRKSVTIFPGFKLNLGKKGVSATIGKRGMSVNIGKRGTYLNSSIPGTGITSRTKISDGHSTPLPTLPEHEQLAAPRRRFHFGKIFWFAIGTTLAGATKSQAVVIGFWIVWAVVALVQKMATPKEQ